MIGVLNLLRNVKFGIGVRQHNKKIFRTLFAQKHVECKKTQGEDKPGNVHDKACWGQGMGVFS
jgi:hypothetical protein